MKLFFQKLKNKSGESLIETLVATLITVLGMMILAGAITTASRGTKAAKELQSSLSTETGADDYSATVNVSYESTTASFQVKLFNYSSEDDDPGSGRLYFYEYEYGND
ncbi:type IV pilus modification PilV family protein [Butyrivibrio sp. AE3006]|uniref:type IV pilus modification PilV family protein n=1 Tax=Butyrivibrio sp. AE3006 TaxID=1280673 RepID=UPI00047AA550|nr:hypothetical protein [Butyrivibrio sp. AE3006]